VGIGHIVSLLTILHDEVEEFAVIGDGSVGIHVLNIRGYIGLNFQCCCQSGLYRKYAVHRSVQVNNQPINTPLSRDS